MNVAARDLYRNEVSLNESTAYLEYALQTFRGAFMADDPYYVMLMSPDYVPDRRGHRVRGDVTFWEIRGEGYRSGGRETEGSVSIDDLDDLMVLDLGGTEWPGPTFLTARFAVYYRRGAEEDVLVACVDFGKNVVSANARFTLSNSSLRWFY